MAHWACSEMRGSGFWAAISRAGRSAGVPVFPRAMQTLRMKRGCLMRLMGDFAKVVRKSSRVIFRKSRRVWEKISGRGWREISREVFAKRFQGQASRQSSQP